MDIDEVVGSDLKLHSVHDPHDNYFSNFALNYSLEANTNTNSNPKEIIKSSHTRVNENSCNKLNEISNSINHNIDCCLSNKNKEKWLNFDRSFINFNSEVSIKKPLSIDQISRLLADKKSVLNFPYDYISDINNTANLPFKSNESNNTFNCFNFSNSSVKSQIFDKNNSLTKSTEFSLIARNYSNNTDFSKGNNNNSSYSNYYNNSSTFEVSNQKDQGRIKLFEDRSSSYFDMSSNNKSSINNCNNKFSNKGFNNDFSRNLQNKNPLNNSTTMCNSFLKSSSELSDEKLLKDDITIRVILNHPSFRSKKEKERRSIMNL